MLFCLPNGLAVEPVLIRKKFLKWQDAHPEFPRIVFHGLRHSSATYQLMISGGDVKAVQGTTGQDVYKRQHRLSPKADVLCGFGCCWKTPALQSLLTASVSYTHLFGAFQDEGSGAALQLVREYLDDAAIVHLI